MPGCIAFQIYNGAVYDQRQGKYRANNSKFRPKGFPDIIGTKTGIPFAIEVKTVKGVVSPEQRDMHITLYNHGWRIRVCRSIEDAIDFMQSIPEITFSGTPKAGDDTR